MWTVHLWAGTAGQSEPGEGPDRKRYSVTSLGKQEVEAWPETGRRYRRPDSDAPGDKYRIYEVAGMGHGMESHNKKFNEDLEQLVQGLF